MMVKNDKGPLAEKEQLYLARSMAVTRACGKGGRAVSLERSLFWSPHSGHVIVQDVGQPSMSPRKLSREWIEQQEVVL